MKKLVKIILNDYCRLHSRMYFAILFNTNLISFHAPKEAISLNVNVYRLEGDENWVSIDDGAISIGTDRDPIKQLIGTLTIIIHFNIR